MDTRKIKKIIITGSLLYFSILLQGQKDPVLAIATKKMNNTLYLGVEIPITVAVEGISCRDVKVEITNGSITGACGKYMVFVKGEIDTTIIKAFFNNKLLATKTYRLKKLPDPKAYVLGKTSGFIYKKDLIDNNIMKAFLKDFRFEEIEFEVIGFELTYKQNGQTITHQSNSNTLTTEMIKALDDLYRDQLIVFKNIRVLGPDEFERVIDSLQFRIR